MKNIFSIVLSIHLLFFIIHPSAVVAGEYKGVEFVVNPQFDDAKRFSEGLAPVKIGDKWGYIDKTGKYVVNPQFLRAEVFSEGLAWVEMGGEQGYKFGCIDKTGKFVINPRNSFVACISARVWLGYG